MTCSRNPPSAALKLSNVDKRLTDVETGWEQLRQSTTLDEGQLQSMTSSITDGIIKTILQSQSGSALNTTESSVNDPPKLPSPTAPSSHPTGKNSIRTRRLN